MPTPPSKRNYRKEYDTYHGTPEQRANRALRNKARAALVKEGRVKKGDGKEVDHKRGIGAGNGKKNLQVLSRHANRTKATKKSK